MPRFYKVILTKKKQYIYIFLLCHFLLQNTSALFGQLDTNYIQNLVPYRTIAPHTTYQNLDVSFSSDNSKTIHLQKETLNLGFRVRYKNLGLSFSVPVHQLNKSKFGQSNSYGFGFQLYPSHFFLQGTVRYTEGFDDLNALNNNGDLVFRKDSRFFFSTLVSNYVVNHRKYSLKAGLKMINIQKKSAGSFIVSLPITFQYFTNDSTRTPVIGQPYFSLEKYQSIRIGIGGGYAYTFVKGNWSATLFASAGPEFRRIETTERSESESKNIYFLNPSVRAVGSVVYNRRDFFYGLVAQFIPDRESVDEALRNQVRNARVRLIFGRRF